MTDIDGSAGSIVIERILDASTDRVWQMWTDPEHFASWYGPDGASIPRAEIDPRVGGSRFICMQMATPDGPMSMWFTGEHRSVVPHERLVYTESVCDESGRVLSAAEMGMPDSHPLVTEVTVELEAVGDRTRMVMTHLGVPSDSPGAAGWAMAFDKLAARV